MKTSRLFDVFALLFCLYFILAGSIVSVNRFWQYDVFYYDFGIFDRAIWQVAHLQKPIIDHLVVSGKWIFADHFSPGIFLFSPLYWLTDKSEMLLIAQAVVVGISGFFLYDLGKIVLKNKFFAASVLFSYYLFIGLQNAVISDFHETTIMTLPFVLVFWAAAKKKKLCTFLFFILMLSFKESAFLIGMGVAIAIFFLQKKWQKFAFILFVTSLLWGFLTIQVIIPYFSGDGYHYSEPILARKDYLATFLFDNTLKRNTLFYSFASFGFLPFFAPQFWLLIFQDFFSRFFAQWSTRWTLGLHYSAILASINGVAAIYALTLLQNIMANRMLKFYCIFLIIISIILYRFVLHGPFALFYNTAFYAHTKDFLFLDLLIKKIPKNVSIMTQNNLAGHFTHQQVFLLRGDPFFYKPDFILIDLRQGQNPNNFFGVIYPKETVEKIKKHPQYMVIYQSKDQYIFKRR
ncbi:MAG: DUF2079 domain-containing protein [Candidatus Levyibacteriota bacterium]|nr:MAG: DUF2079 domain-containing protein [Candidatus Levybacteria bacterium]